MTLRIPAESLFITDRLQHHGFEAYLVGGAVRDLLIISQENAANEQATVTVTDLDFTTNAVPEQIQAVFPESFYENQYGTVSIPFTDMYDLIKQSGWVVNELPLSAEGQTPTVIDVQGATKVHESLTLPISTEPKIEPPKPFEITTFRADGIYTDHRRPESVVWGQSIEDDLARRDFTINAMALKLTVNLQDKVNSNSQFPKFIELSEKEFVLIDPFQGKSDLQNKIIKSVRDPNERFQEDALRMLRAVRFAVQLDFSIEPITFAAITHQKELLRFISWERIRDELLKIIKSSNPKEGILLLERTGLLSFVLPELLEMKGVEQGGHHTTDVWTHSLDALAHCPSPDPIVRLATLLHDVGKPLTYHQQDGNITFYNHEIIGSRIAVKIARRLLLSKKDIDRLFTLVRYHMFYYQPEHTDASIRRFMRRVGLQNLNDILALREGDRLGSGAKKTSWRLEEMKSRIEAQLHQPFDLKDLAVSGTDLMTEFSLKPGPIIGVLLKELFELVLEDPSQNQRDILLDKAQEILKLQTE